MINKILIQIFVINLLILPNLFAQYYLGYYFTPTDYDYFTEITGGTISTATGVYGAQNITLPFPFKYMGINYTTARISVNGWLEMGQTYTGLGYSNNLSSTIKKPLICPLWDDLYDDSLSEIRYETLGAYPARIFVVQWENIRWRDVSSVRKTFQVRLWEIDGTIDLVYGPGTSDGNLSYSIGMNDTTGGTDHFISISPAYSYYMPTVSTSVSNDTIKSISPLRSGMVYSFVPVDPMSYKQTLQYQTPDSIVLGAANQKILAIIVPCHAGSVLTPPWVTGFNFSTYGTTNTNDLLNAKLFYTGSSPIFSSQTQLGQTITNPNGLFTISGFSTYLINNNVSYFWLAYDISPDAVVGNFVDGNCYKIDRTGCCPPLFPDSSLTTAVCVIKQNPTTVHYSVGIDGHFNSLTQAIYTLKNTTITSPIILELTNNYDSSNETFPIIIPRFNGSSAVNTLTIRPSFNISNKINFTSNDSIVFIFDNSLHVTLDGRPGGIGDSNYILIRNNLSSFSTIKFLDNCRFNTLEYCDIFGSDSTMNGGVIYFQNTWDLLSAENNTIKNCLVDKSYFDFPSNCIKIFRTNYYSSANNNNEIIKCEIRNFTRAGIEFNGCTNMLIENNLIHHTIPTPGNNFFGIINNVCRNVNIKKCKILNITPSGNSTNSITGIYNYNCNGYKIENNFISLAGNSFSNLKGIYTYFGHTNFTLQYNSILIYGESLSSASSFGFGVANPTTGSGNWYLMCNIIHNIRTSLSGSSDHLALKILGNNSYANLDYNNYYVLASNPYIGLWGSTLVSNIQQWKTITGRDVHSISKNVNFVSNTDLHLTGSSLGDTDLIGTPISSILTDIDGESRHQFYPYMGADENTEFPLPVELISFNADKDVNIVNLSWTTVTETNNKGFQVERKKACTEIVEVEKGNSFEAVGFVNGKGTSTELNYYSFKDENLSPGKYKYRLKQIDFNGSFEYSNEIEVEIAVPDKFALYQNYPNPFNPTTKIKYSIPSLALRERVSEGRVRVLLKVYDILGNEITTLVNEEKSPGVYEVEFNASQLPSGVYFYRLRAGGYDMAKKLIFMK